MRKKNIAFFFFCFFSGALFANHQGPFNASLLGAYSFSYDPNNFKEAFGSEPDAYLGHLPKIEKKEVHNCRFCAQSFKSIDALSKHLDQEMMVVDKSLEKKGISRGDSFAREENAESFIFKYRRANSQKNLPLMEAVVCSFCSKTFKKGIDFDAHILIMHQSFPLFGKEEKALGKRESGAIKKENFFEKRVPIEKEEKLLKKGRSKRKKAHFYLCLFCGESLKTRANLDQHRRIHKKERPFSCQICKNRFKKKEKWKKHQKKCKKKGRKVHCLKKKIG